MMRTLHKLTQNKRRSSYKERTPAFKLLVIRNTQQKATLLVRK